MKHTKTVRAFTKAVDEADRTVEQIVSVFENVDLGKDRVKAHAFEESLGEWSASGDPIPVIWSHMWDDPFAHVGFVLEAKELLPGDPLLPDELAELGGLYVKEKYDEAPFADQVFRLLKERRVREASFAYDILEEKKNSDGTTDLVRLGLIEVGPTLKGMNPLTLTLKSLVSRVKALGPDADDEEIEAVIEDVIEEGTKSTPPHAFLPKTDDPDRCTVCDLTRGTVAHLHTLSAGADGAKAVVHLAGSVEERLDRIHAAGLDVIDLDAANGGFYDLAIEGTFDDRVVYRLEGWNDPVGGGSFFECAIETETDDELVLGEPVEVVVEGSTRAKSARAKRDRERSESVKSFVRGTVETVLDPDVVVVDEPNVKGLSPESTRSLLDALEVELS